MLMKTKLILLILVALLQTSLKSQSFRFGTVAADIGFGGGLYGIKGYSPVNNSNVSGFGVVGTLPRISAEFGVARFFGAGISFRRGTYGKGSGGKLRGSDFMFRGNFHLANKKMLSTL